MSEWWYFVRLCWFNRWMFVWYFLCMIMYVSIEVIGQQKRYQKIPGSNPGQDYHVMSCLVGPTVRRLTTEYISFTFLHKLCHIWHNWWSTLEILLSYSHAHPVKTPTIYSIFYVLKEETHYTILYYFIMKAYTLLIDTKLHVSSVQYTKWNTESNNTILPKGIFTHTTMPLIHVLLFM